ncbi:MAG: hypothetical protein IJH63_10390 [Methanobrevibacter sp.]|nr:hypothetical protein [Methanobrevibacter sp.]
MKCTSMCPYAKVNSYTYNNRTEKATTHIRCKKEGENVTGDTECLCNYNIEDILELVKTAGRVGYHGF